MTDSNSSPTRLRALLDTVHHNERTLRRFQQIELRLVGAVDFSKFYDALTNDLANVFDLTHIVLWLNEEVPLLRNLIEFLSHSTQSSPGLRWGRVDDFSLGFEDGRCRPWLGPGAQLGTDVRRAMSLDVEIPQSVAILPLLEQRDITGYLCLCSTDTTRFTAGMATDLLERFGAFVSAGLINVAHREYISRQGITDMLTNLPNRRHFDIRLRDEVQRAAKSTKPIACLFIDVDHFKRVNDTYGHAVGDRVLAAIGACIRNAVRVDDTVARYGGEEFVVLIQGDTALASVMAERIRAAVEAIVVTDDKGNQIPLTVSIGLVARNITAQDNDEERIGQLLVEEADRALYAAKRGGRNCVVVHRSDGNCG